MKRYVSAAYMYLNYARRETKNKLAFDEVSILFREKQPFLELVQEAKREGLWFNHSQETQVDTKTGNVYHTNYQFLWPDREAGWRIEAMHITGGFAPLHEEIMQAKGTPCIAHVSYKLDSVKEYRAARRDLRKLIHRNSLAEYQNGYGLFSYFPIYDEHGKVRVYIKPRVNIRDNSEEPIREEDNATNSIDSWSPRV